MLACAVWILVLASGCCAGPLESGPEPLVLKYHQRTMTPPSGASFQLSCTALYAPEACGWVHVFWCRDPPNFQELRDPGRFLTTVNETGGAGGRRRTVVTRILAARRDDSGLYQCIGACEGANAAAGHLITVRVDGV